MIVASLGGRAEVLKCLALEVAIEKILTQFSFFGEGNNSLTLLRRVGLSSFTRPVMHLRVRLT